MCQELFYFSYLMFHLMLVLITLRRLKCHAFAWCASIFTFPALSYFSALKSMTWKHNESIFPPPLDFTRKIWFNNIFFDSKDGNFLPFFYNLAFFTHKSKEIDRERRNGGKFYISAASSLWKLFEQKKSLLMRILRTQNLITFSCHLNYVPCLLCEKLFFH